MDEQTPVEQPQEQPVAEQPTEQPVEQPEAQAVEQPTPEPEATPVEPTKSPEQDFLDKYDALATETGLVFKVEPKFVQNADKTYDLNKFTIQVSVGKK